MKRLLFTGGTGFVGRNIMADLQQLYDVTVCGAPIVDRQYDIVFHASGKAHSIPHTESEVNEFFDANYGGTVNLCAGLDHFGIPESIIYLSTVAVYGCESGKMIDETHPLDGTTPYAKSKLMAEQYLSEWCAARGVCLTILRSALIAGRDAPGNLGAMVNAISRGRYVNIAGGRARKSMLMAHDLVRLIPLVASRGGVYNVCDDHHPSFAELSSLISSSLGCPLPLSIPYPIAKLLALICDCFSLRFPFNSGRLSKMTQSLTFSNARARYALGWTPLDVLSEYRP